MKPRKRPSAKPSAVGSTALFDNRLYTIIIGLELLGERELARRICVEHGICKEKDGGDVKTPDGKCLNPNPQGKLEAITALAAPSGSTIYEY